VFTGLLFGALPAWSASRGDAAAALKEAGARGTAGRRTASIRSGLVVGEIALAVMLLSTSGLLVRSFEKMQQESPGFNPGGVITARLALPAARYDQAAKRNAFVNEVLARLRGHPAVTAAGVTDVLPFTGNNSQGSYNSPDIVLAPGTPEPHGQMRDVDPGFFQAMGIALLRGRLFTDTDTAQSQRVVVIDKVLADRYWPGQDPIGKRVDRGGEAPNYRVIVGVVTPIKTASLEDPMKKETMYFPFAQESASNFAVVAKTAGDPALLASVVREAVHSADPEEPVFDVKTMPERMYDVAQTRRAPMLLLAMFSSVALLLAVIGVYGVLAFSVAQRTSEFGVRIALGATTRDIAVLVLRQGSWLVVTGLVTGLVGYLALSRIVGRMLYGIAPTDPLALSVAPLLLAFAALLACLHPVRKATRVNPLEALRAE
jgi:predicted permease